MAKKILAFFLAILMIVPMLPGSCTSSSATLPETLDYKGETVIFLCRDSAFVADEVIVDDMNGAMVNDAIYTRNEKVQKMLGVTFESVKITGTDNYVISN